MNFDTIIIGGSYAGLSAAMSLGRALRNVLIIDSGKPCNIQTPYSHNFLTRDGEAPDDIREIGKDQVTKYNTVQFYSGFAVNTTRKDNGFEVKTQSGDIFECRNLILATGVIDVIPDMKGFAECWGKTIIHCPYCHGYEVKGEKTGILANGDAAYESVKHILNWTKDLRLFTNGKSTLSEEQTEKIRNNGIPIIEKEIEFIEQTDGRIENLVFIDNSREAVTALYASPERLQSCNIPEQLGCKLTDNGTIEVDLFQKTSVEGVFACGDNATVGRSIAVAVQAGSIAGVFANKELIEEEF